MDLMLAVIAGLAAYILGSISFAVIFSKLFAKKDVRKYGSGNAGMTNVMRVAGRLPGILTFICDVLKGFLACLIGWWLFSISYSDTGYAIYQPLYGAYFCGILAMLGHVFPVFFGFKGGKAVAICLGVMGVCNWPVMLLALGIFLVFVLITKIVSVGSIFAALSLIILTPFFDMSMTAIFMPVDNNGSTLWVTLLSAVMAAIVILKHTDNIRRLIKGTEKPLTVKENKNV